MNKIVKIFLALVVIGAIVAYFVFQYAMKDVEDQSKNAASINISFVDYESAVAKSDTTFLNSCNNKLVAISGLAKDINIEDSTTTIIIGDSLSDNTITCQIDSRYINDFKTIKLWDALNIKGMGAGYLADELGLGNNLQFKNCVLNK